MTKVFEGEVSASIRLMGGYSHKCPDHPHAIPDKVDFLWCYNGRFVGVEAKETTNQSEVPCEIVSPNQRACLDRIENSGGIGLVLVNFDRKRGVQGRRGHAVAFEWSTARNMSILSLGTGILLGRLPGAWDLRPLFGRS